LSSTKNSVVPDRPDACLTNDQAQARLGAPAIHYARLCIPALPSTNAHVLRLPEIISARIAIPASNELLNTASLFCAVFDIEQLLSLWLGPLWHSQGAEDNGGQARGLVYGLVVAAGRDLAAASAWLA